MVAAKKKSAPKKSTKAPKAKAAKPKDSAIEKEKQRVRELEEYSGRLRQAQADINEAELAMVRAKGMSKEAGAHYQSCIGAMRRLVDEYENPQKNLPLFHNNGNVNGHQPPATQQPAVVAPKAEEKPADKPTLNISTESWRSVLLSTLKISKGLLKKLDEAGIETIGGVTDLNGKHVSGIGPEGMAKVSDAIAAYHKANPVESKEVRTEAEMEKATEEIIDAVGSV